MRKIFTLLFTLMFAYTMQAQEIKLTLNNGNVVSGTTKSLFMYDNSYEITVKDSKTEEKKDYSSADVKSVKYFNEKEKKWITFVPLMAQKCMPSIWNKSPKPYKNPVFMSPLYEGKRVSAYMHMISTQTNTKKLQISGSGCIYYFLVKGENVAKAFWMSSAIGVKAMLKIVFKDYPEMKPIIKELDTDKFYEDPLMIIREFDEAK